MNGIINVYKERGFTSHDVVAKLRGILHQKKIGHTGTLDPDAEGVLPVCVGKATKVCDLLTEKDKTYEACVRLGVTTDTLDMTGEILCRREVTVTEEDIRQTLQEFTGTILQIPPMYSAIKINGKKLYELARKGQEVQRAPRPVTIHELTMLSCDLSQHTFKIRVSCSKGTYIRSLCHDIGQKLGCGAAMQSLLRTRVGNFAIADAMRLAEIEEIFLDSGQTAFLKPVDSLFAAYPKVTAAISAMRFLQNGNSLAARFVEGDPVCHGQQVRMYAWDGDFYAIYRYDATDKMYHIVKMFHE